MMKTEKKINGIIVKFANLNRLQSFQEKGEICFTNLNRFSKINHDNNKVQFDSLEGYTHQQPAKNIKFHLKNKDSSSRLIGTALKGVFRFSDFDGYGYCLSTYFINIPEYFTDFKHTVDERMCSDYEYCLVILNTQEFVSRLERTVNSNNQLFTSGFSEYIPLKMDYIQKNFFQKDVDYSFQNELRFLIRNKQNEERLIVEIGNIADISIIQKVSKSLVFEFTSEVNKFNLLS